MCNKCTHDTTSDEKNNGTNNTHIQRKTKPKSHAAQRIGAWLRGIRTRSRGLTVWTDIITVSMERESLFFYNENAVVNDKRVLICQTQFFSTAKVWIRPKLYKTLFGQGLWRVKKRTRSITCGWLRNKGAKHTQEDGRQREKKNDEICLFKVTFFHPNSLYIWTALHDESIYISLC